MLDEVARHIRRERMFRPLEPVTVAVSGGIDSMVLLHVLRKLKHPCSVVHVDHGMRGGESDGDREFVEGHCRMEGIPFQWCRVDVKALMEERPISTQMAARELRYEWFDGLIAQSDPQKIALAHHADDAVETLLINLMRGAGTNGWGTMEPVRGSYVRPLLCVHRSDVVAYAQQHSIAYREDSSNRSDKYLRNRIRNQVVPLLEELRPGASRAMARSVRLLRDLTELGSAALRDLPDASVTGADGATRIPFADLEATPYSGIRLYSVLRGFGFHPDTIDRIHDAITERVTGAEFTAASARVVVDRNDLFVIEQPTAPGIILIEPGMEARSSGPFEWRFLDGNTVSIPSTMSEVVLDAGTLSFPIELRPWREGDRMRPIGLGGTKLVSDILIDAKVPKHEKERTYVLVSAGEIAWLVGHRIGEGFQITSNTDQVLWVRGE